MRLIPSATLRRSGADGRQIERAIRARLVEAGIDGQSSPAQVADAIAAIRADVPPWCEHAAWERMTQIFVDWARSFNGLAVMFAIDGAAGKKISLLRLHHQTLPDLRARWMSGYVPEAPVDIEGLLAGTEEDDEDEHNQRDFLAAAD